MKKINQFLLFGTALLFLPLLQSCEDDDDNPGDGPTAITYPHTIVFSHFENVDFEMWTNGAEVNTSGLDFFDFLDEEDEEGSLLYAEYYQSNPGLTFTEDSIFTADVDSLIVGFPYFISNDSVYWQVESVFGSDTISYNAFLGLGSAAQLKLVQGFSQFCNIYVGEFTIIDCNSNLQQEFQTLESAMDEYGISSLENIQEGDTLIINNRYVFYN